MEEEYINTKVRPILEELLDSLLEDTPEEPLPYMFQWLQKYDGQVSLEREELLNLREEIKKYRQNNNNNSQSQNQSRNKFKIESGGDSKNLSSDNSEKEEEEDEKNDDFQQSLEERRKKIKAKGQRSGISAEAYGQFNKKEDFKPRVIKKTEEQMESIKKRVSGSIIFSNLDERELVDVINACEEQKFKAGDYVIKEGDNGDELFVVETGELICEKGDPPIFLKNYFSGDSFGELALLYNAPRAATIKAKTDCVLWALDRMTFTNIVRESAINGREKLKKCLEKVEILSTVEPYELYSICEAVQKERVLKGNYIIREGEKGNKFYILDEGEAVATKVINKGEEPKEVKRYTSGGYFGELALLRNGPRAASILAVTDCRLLSLDRPAFKRLLGPLEDILKRNIEAYKKYNLSL